MNQFQVGTEYSARSLGDYDCVWTFTVIKRTARFVTIQGRGLDGPKRLGIKMLDGVEYVRPLGSYSLAPFLMADSRA